MRWPSPQRTPPGHGSSGGRGGTRSRGPHGAPAAAPFHTRCSAIARPATGAATPAPPPNGTQPPSPWRHMADRSVCALCRVRACHRPIAMESPMGPFGCAPTAPPPLFGGVCGKTRVIVGKGQVRLRQMTGTVHCPHTFGCPMILRVRTRIPRLLWALHVASRGYRPHSDTRACDASPGVAIMKKKKKTRSVQYAL